VTSDIFAFWSVVGPNDRIHPADKSALVSHKYNFDLNCLPGCFMGPLRTAPVVLLYASPGLATEIDRREAANPEIQQIYLRQRTGNEPLPRPQLAGWWPWLRRQTGVIGEWERVRARVAILDIGAYKSISAPSDTLLKKLPSSQVVLKWAAEVLFPQARAGERVVVCRRSCRNWPLHPTSLSG
jgi:hypothetical protein